MTMTAAGSAAYQLMAPNNASTDTSFELLTYDLA